MKLKDILSNYSKFPITCMERTYYPKFLEDDLTDKEKNDGMLSGYCQWDGVKLSSLDGDYYSLDENILKYEWDNNMLIYWVDCNWE